MDKLWFTATFMVTTQASVASCCKLVQQNHLDFNTPPKIAVGFNTILPEMMSVGPKKPCISMVEESINPSRGQKLSLQTGRFTELHLYLCCVSPFHGEQDQLRGPTTPTPISAAGTSSCLCSHALKPIPELAPPKKFSLSLLPKSCQGLEKVQAS